MRPTRWYVLVAVGIAAGAVGYLITRASYSDLPSPTLYAQISLFVLAIAEAYTASITKARLDGRPGTRAIDPLVVARLVALAKASSIVGALAVGAYAGFLGWVGQLTSTTAHSDIRTAAAGIAAGFALVAGALYLEWVGRVPDEPIDDDQ
ncbi:MAG TPA: DUF3180 domain-containing protein [Mycobacteriales bacterium]|jgi:hypothetical protein|nr:DUF3180 domain-containing protein [Mycobacteriales bacterium]